MHSLDQVRLALTNLANEINDAIDSPDVSEEGVDYLRQMETKVEDLTREFDKDRENSERKE